MGTEIFIPLGVITVELLAFEVSMVSDANWPR